MSRTKKAGKTIKAYRKKPGQGFLLPYQPNDVSDTENPFGLRLLQYAIGGLNTYNHTVVPVADATVFIFTPTNPDTSVIRNCFNCISRS